MYFSALWDLVQDIGGLKEVISCLDFLFAGQMLL